MWLLDVKRRKNEKAQTPGAEKKAEPDQQAKPVSPDIQPAAEKPTDKDISRIRTLIDYCSKALAEKGTAGREGFRIYGTENVGVLDLKEPDTPAEKWRVQISAVRNHTDWMASNFLWAGTRDEVVSQMLAEAGQEEILNSVMALSDRVDQHWNE